MLLSNVLVSELSKETLDSLFLDDEVDERRVELRLGIEPLNVYY